MSLAKPGLLAAWSHQFITGLGNSWNGKGTLRRERVVPGPDLTCHMVGAEGLGPGRNVCSLLPTPMLNRMATPKRNSTVGLWKPSFSPCDKFLNTFFFFLPKSLN